MPGKKVDVVNCGVSDALHEINDAPNGPPLGETMGYFGRDPPYGAWRGPKSNQIHRYRYTILLSNFSAIHKMEICFPATATTFQ